MYWFGSDRTGWRFAEALADRARAGVKVRISYDAVGSWDSEDAVFETMREAGCEVYEHAPIRPWRRRFKIGVLNNRDHRKMLVVDGRICFTGGINFGDPWASIEDGGEGWRDDMIRVEGPAARQMREIFLDSWRAAHAEPSDDEPEPEAPEAKEGSQVRVVSNHYRGTRRAIRREYLSRIATARERIVIANSYFIPDRVVRRALADAARRGVEVNVLLPGDNDVPAVQWASRRLYGWLMKRGIQLFEWYGTVLHSKSAVIDGHWCTVGSYNLDWRSLRFNLEVVAVVEDDRVGRALEERLAQDLERATPVRLADWRYRPLGDRLLERFFFQFRKLL
ncbi:MAG: phospholipase D-like domain-containing protein, partial [Polyangiales bacterium]